MRVGCGAHMHIRRMWVAFNERHDGEPVGFRRVRGGGGRERRKINSTNPLIGEALHTCLNFRE